LQIKTKIVSRHTANSKPVKQEVNGTVILPPLVFPDETVVVCWPKSQQTPTNNKSIKLTDLGIQVLGLSC
jgi:hypothetical protein